MKNAIEARTKIPKATGATGDPKRAKIIATSGDLQALKESLATAEQKVTDLSQVVEQWAARSNYFELECERIKNERVSLASIESTLVKIGEKIHQCNGCMRFLFWDEATSVPK